MMNILNRQVPVFDLARFSDDPKQIAAFELIQFSGLLRVVNGRYELQLSVNEVDDEGWIVAEKGNDDIDQRLSVGVLQA